jgi:hypothetical protein
MSEDKPTYNTPASLEMKLVSRNRSKEIAELGDWLDSHKHYISMNDLPADCRKEWLKKWGLYMEMNKENRV